MKKVILLCGLLAIVAVATVFVSVRNAESERLSLLRQNIEALTNEEEGDDDDKTCYYINVYGPNPPYLLSCSTCEYKYGYGKPTAKCL